MCKEGYYFAEVGGDQYSNFPWDRTKRNFLKCIMTIFQLRVHRKHLSL